MEADRKGSAAVPRTEQEEMTEVCNERCEMFFKQKEAIWGFGVERKRQSRYRDYYFRC